MGGVFENGNPVYDPGLSQLNIIQDALPEANGYSNLNPLPLIIKNIENPFHTQQDCSTSSIKIKK